MTSSNNDLLDTLRHYTSHLEEKNKALSELCDISTLLSSMLEMEEDTSVDNALKQREKQCKRLIDLCKNDSGALVDAARTLARDSKDELGQAACILLALNSRSEALSAEVMTSQKQCETVLKTRLDATSRALRDSIHRRKLDAAYGPASSHSTPAFLDKHR